MEYYLGKILERNGDFEYTSDYLFTTDGDPQQYAEAQAKEWRGSTDDDWDEDQDGWWCDSTLIFNGGHTKIPKEEFEVLSKHLSVL